MFSLRNRSRCYVKLLYGTAPANSGKVLKHVARISIGVDGLSTLDLPPLLTGSRGEYLRVVGIHSDAGIDREISLVYCPFQMIVAGRVYSYSFR